MTGKISVVIFGPGNWERVVRQMPDERRVYWNCCRFSIAFDMVSASVGQ